jgi:hypothetical protein
VSGAPWKETLAFQNRGFGAKIPRAVQRQYQRSEDGQAPPHAMELAIDAANRYLPLAAIFAMLRQLAASRHHRSKMTPLTGQERPTCSLRLPETLVDQRGHSWGEARAAARRDAPPRIFARTGQRRATTR